MPIKITPKENVPEVIYHEIQQNASNQETGWQLG
jgi:hypothetical protein